jgi:glyoxylase-like metal-dependent hydrolase (beta-lactamase superfamily II)
MPITDTTIEGLHPSAPAALSFSDAIQVRTFRLTRPQGDLLIYAAAGADAEGVTHQYLGHWHEAAEGGPATGADVFVHAGDAAETTSRLHVRGTFSHAFTLDDDFDAIPMPGHTPGSTAYLWRTGEHRVLFTADSLYPDPEGTWKVALLDSSDRAAYIESLERLAEIEFDVLAPWAAPTGHPGFVVTDPADARARVTEAVRRLRNGQNR